MDRTEEIFKDYLTRNGLQMTIQRRAVFLAFQTIEGHVSAEEIFEIVNQAGINVGIAAVWRTLRLIKKAGLAEEHYFGKAGMRYERKKAPESHGHIICQECERAEEFDLTEILPLIHKVGGRHGLEVEGYELSIFGKCQTCRSTSTVDSASRIDGKKKN